MNQQFEIGGEVGGLQTAPGGHNVADPHAYQQDVDVGAAVAVDFVDEESRRNDESEQSVEDLDQE